MKFHDAINEVRSRVNIVDVIGKSVRLKRSGNNYMGLCPFHNEKTPSFVVSESKQIYKCFGCEKGGNVYSFLQEHEGMTFPEAVKYLARQVNVTIDDEFHQNNELNKKREYMLKLYKDVANNYYKCLYSEDGKNGLIYLTKRGLTKETIKKFGLGFAPKESSYMYKLMKKNGYDDNLLLESKLFFMGEKEPFDFFRERVMFPLVDSYGNVVSFQGRILEGNTQKYINTAGSIIYNKSRHLFAINFARMTKKDYYILCEGNMDAITLHQAGFDNAIASWGTAFTIEQANLIKRKVRKVYLCQDTDDAGVKAIEAASKICETVGLETYVLDLSPAKDADEFINKYGKEEFSKKLESPKSTFMFLVSALRKQLDLKNPYDYKKYIEILVKRLCSFDNKILREKYVKDIAIQENLSFEDLIRQVEKFFESNGAVSLNIDTETKSYNDYNKVSDIIKVEKLLVSFIVNDKNIKDQVKNSLDVDDFTDEACKYIIKCYYDGKNINEILDLSNELTEEISSSVNEIILSNEYLIDEIEHDDIITTINELIRKIKINSLSKNNINDLKHTLENNIKIKEIKNTIYIK